MAKVIKAVVKLKSTDTLIDDSSFHFVFKSASATSYGDLTSISTAVATFLNTTPAGGAHPVARYLANVLDRSSGASLVEMYDITAHLDGTPAGAPVGLVPFTLAAIGATTQDVPAGCAAVLSFRSSYGTDVEFGTGTRPRSRDRNRVYLGPLNLLGLMNTLSGAGRAILNPNLVADALHALYALATTFGTESWVLQQWSPTAAATKILEQAWMDSRVDYQRRRSDADPSSRTYLTMPSV